MREDITKLVHHLKKKETKSLQKLFFSFPTNKIFKIIQKRDKKTPASLLKKAKYSLKLYQRI
jgi:hypothetical protein